MVLAKLTLNGEHCTVTEVTNIKIRHINHNCVRTACFCLPCGNIRLELQAVAVREEGTSTDDI